MKTIDVGRTLAIIANFGEIAGIVLLAIEVRQNQQTLEEGNTMNLIAIGNIAQEHFSHFRNLLLENDELFSIWQRGLMDEELSGLDDAKFEELCSEQVFRMATTLRIFSRIGDDFDRTGAAFVVQRNINQSRRYAECWERVKPALLGRDNINFVEMVDGGTE